MPWLSSRTPATPLPAAAKRSPPPYSQTPVATVAHSARPSCSHISAGWSVAPLAKHAKNGIVCVRSSRVTTGQIGRNVEVYDNKLGLVASLEHNPQKARVLLRLALLKQRTNADLQRLFDQY